MPTFIGKPVTVAEDKQLQVGDILRDFNLTATDLSQKTLSEFDGKKKVISILPSIDTGICSTQTRTFNKELSELDDIVVITISVDLPLAQARWCGAEGLENAIMLSDYYDNSFGKQVCHPAYLQRADPYPLPFQPTVHERNYDRDCRQVPDAYRKN